MRDLTTLIDDNGVFTDVSIDTNNFLNDSTSLTFVAAEDAIYIGLFKPFYSIFLNINNVSVGSNGLTAEFSNGAGFSPLAVTDDTKGFTRNGFIKWEKDVFDSWLSQDVNGISLFWIRFTLTTDFTADIQGLNLLFANDDDLRGVQRDIDRYRFSGDTDFVPYHVSARDEIIQSLRNSGYSTRINTSAPNDLTQWDILDINQVRNAAKYLALSNIMFDVSANETDKYYQKWRDYKSMYAEAFKLYLLWLDRDDDGELDASEQEYFRSVRLMKL